MGTASVHWGPNNNATTKSDRLNKPTATGNATKLIRPYTSRKRTSSFSLALANCA
jgi:hypothetical protein